MYHLLSECCGEEPDDSFHFNYTWRLGTCIKCKEKTEFKDRSENEKEH